MKGLMRHLVRWTLDQASRGYCAGPLLEHALSVRSHLNRRGYQVTLGYWNKPGEDPNTVIADYIAALERLGASATTDYLSIKIPTLKWDRELCARLFAASCIAGVPLHFDSLGPRGVDRTLALIEEYRSDLAGAVGITLPGRWRRSPLDAEKIIELELLPRVVKGQWVDPEEPERDPYAGVLAVVRALAGKVPCVRIATHDLLLAREAASLLHAAGTRCELELLYGLPVRQLVAFAQDTHLPVRVYVPYGTAWVPYCLSTIRRQPQVLWWLTKDLLAGGYAGRFPELKRSI